MPDLSGAYYIAHQLEQAGFRALFAGGWVRDHLLGHDSADVDIATSALPKDVTALFPKTVSVGAHFGVTVVIEEGTPYEVATFRCDGPYYDGRHPESISFSDEYADAQRRDFTINGLFMEPATGKILDYVGGVADLNAKLVRAIGKPSERFNEDRLRMLRAVRFCSCLHFKLDEATATAIKDLAPTIKDSVSAERVSAELAKMANHGVLLEGLAMMDQLQLLDVLFPDHDELPQKLDADLPMILQLVALYRRHSSDRWLRLTYDLKLSNEERRMVETLQEAQRLLATGLKDPVEWAHLLARPWAEECLQACLEWPETPSCPKEQFDAWLDRLEPHSQRIASRQPLVTAIDLLQRGIEPGPNMGHWLKCAERIAIELDLQDPKEVLEHLSLPAGD